MTRTDRRRLVKEKVVPAVTDLILRCDVQGGWPMTSVWLEGVGRLKIVLERSD
jgi:hypothetical protein